MKHRNKILTLALAGAAMIATQAQAQFSYTQGDLVLFFRSAGVNDVAVNLGLASTYVNQSATPLAVTQFSYSSLVSALGDLSAAQWSVNGENAGGAWISRGRTSDSVQSTAWGSRTASQLGTTKSEIGGAATRFAAVGTDLSGGGRTLADSDGAGYTQNMLNASSIPNWDGTWLGDPERTGFGRLDLYSLTPGVSGVYQGYFEFLSDGTMTFYSENYTSAVPEPATYGLLAGVGLLAVAIRRQIKTA